MIKKFICGILLGCLSLSVVGCGGDKANSESSSEVKEEQEASIITGTWELTSLVVDGSTYTMDEVLAMGDESMKDTYFVLKDGGNVVIYSAGNSNSGKWELVGSKVTIGVQSGEYDGEKITLTMENGNQLILTKYSDDQNFVFKAEETGKESSNEDNNTDVSTNEQATATETSLIEFADTYESFMNEYIDFMKKYKEDPTNTKLLADYGKMMEKYSDFTGKTGAIKEGDYSTEDYKYYLEVLNRCNQNLVEVL